MGDVPRPNTALDWSISLNVFAVTTGPCHSREPKDRILTDTVIEFVPPYPIGVSGQALHMDCKPVVLWGFDLDWAELSGAGRVGDLGLGKDAVNDRVSCAVISCEVSP